MPAPVSRGGSCVEDRSPRRGGLFQAAPGVSVTSRVELASARCGAGDGHGRAVTEPVGRRVGRGLPRVSYTFRGPGIRGAPKCCEPAHEGWTANTSRYLARRTDESAGNCPAQRCERRASYFSSSARRRARMNSSAVAISRASSKPPPYSAALVALKVLTRACACTRTE
jgi:hypothetical protein